MTLTDTHCHIHEAGYPNAEGAYERAMDAGVKRLICVGTDEKTSAEAVQFASNHDNVWASVGLHPHDAKNGVKAVGELEQLLWATTSSSLSSGSLASSVQFVSSRSGAEPEPSESDNEALAAAPVIPPEPGSGHTPERSKINWKLALSERGEKGITGEAVSKSKIVAIGECGLDYYYDNSPREQQLEMLEAQLELAEKYDLPVIFHVREAFDDFWPIFDYFKALRGVLHSFTDNMSSLEKGLSRGLYVGVNGISTFATDKQEMYKAIPLNRLVLETDAPFLTPVPLRGTLNEPAFLTHIAQHIANLRSISLEELSRATELNATNIFFKHQ
jgi:TatD family hydrolase